MDLSINRLKILGEEEIKKLDLKIAEYKSKNKKSILDKSIDEIKRQISDFSTICENMEVEIDTQSLKLSNMNKTLKTYESKYTGLTQELSELQSSIFKIEEKKKDYESQFIIKEQSIKSLKENETKLKDKLSELSLLIEKRKEDYITEKQTIESRIKMLELKMSSLMETSLSSHCEFVSQLKSIKLLPLVEDNQIIFDNIKFNLVKVLARNAEKYSKHIDKLHFMVKYSETKARQWDRSNADRIKKQEEYYYAPQPFGSINGPGVLEPNIKYISGYFGYKYLSSDLKDNIYILNKESDEMHRIICCLDGHRSMCSSKPNNDCIICKFPKFPQGISSLNRDPHQIIKQTNENNKSFNLKLCKWIEDKDNYSKILHKIIKNAELLKLSDELTYKEFYDLFYNSQLFELSDYNSPKHNSLKFISLVAFVGSNGYDINFTECIEE
jgi:hypothetical protein